MIIRKIDDGDNKVIAGIIRTVMSEFDADPQTTILGDPTLDEMFETYQQPRSVYYVIEENERIVGGCGIRQLDNSSENICELQRMFLLPAVRGKGYGKSLIELCLKNAREFGYNQIYLETMSQMKTAIALYAKYGFSKTANPLGNTGHSGCNTYMILQLTTGSKKQ